MQYWIFSQKMHIENNNQLLDYIVIVNVIFTTLAHCIKTREDSGEKNIILYIYMPCYNANRKL